ncbi:MAG: ABC transporter permease [Alphaproteobacteria bacterium]|nr:ABC transporter permease [Alphaproteobacteria bacterium]MDX5368454.1 ABC transporter permease [Alphaproteobacteria bacterium]MDX5463249.1 ABC transporter permease [Alphaproteobacteria bacterium]
MTGSPLLPQAGAAASARRIGAMVARYWYLLRGSGPRILELVYWPTVMMLLWGFVQSFMTTQSGFFAQAAGVLIAGVMLWDIVFRGQLGVSLSFFEELWSRNVGHLMVSPLRTGEWIAALLVMSAVRTTLGLVPASLLAIWFFDFSIYGLGPVLGLFFANLIAFGWAVGLFVSGLVLRYGQGAESLAWALIFAVAPFAAVYYPVSTLPVWLQPVAAMLPPAHVFEGMRAVLIDETIRWDHLTYAAALNLLYLTAGTLAFMAFFRRAREHGMILQLGE